MPTIPNFPSNSTNRGNNSRKNVEPVVTGRVSQRRSTVSNVRSIGNGLFEDIILPAIKDMLYAFLSTGARMFIFGQDSSDIHTPYFNNRPAIRRTSYSRPYSHRDESRIRSARRTAQPIEDLGAYQDIVFDDFNDASRVLGHMMEFVAEYGVATIGDLYALCSMPTNYTQQRWGWRDLSGVTVAATHDGYIITFPEVMFFN